MSRLPPIINHATRHAGADFVVGKDPFDLKYEDVFALAEEKQLETGRPVVIFLKNNADVTFSVESGYGDGTVVDVPGSVHIYGQNVDLCRVNSPLRFPNGGRHDLVDFSLMLPTGSVERAIHMPSGGITVAAFRMLVRGGGGAGGNHAVEVASGFFLMKGGCLFKSGSNPKSTLRQAGGSVLLQESVILTTPDFDDPVLLLDGGFFGMRQSILQNPIDLNAGTCALFNVEWDAFQAGFTGGAAADIAAPAVLELRGMGTEVAGADGDATEVFTGAGSVDHGGFAVPDLDAAGTIFAAGITEIRRDVRLGVGV